MQTVVSILASSHSSMVAKSLGTHLNLHAISGTLTLLPILTKMPSHFTVVSWASSNRQFNELSLQSPPRKVPLATSFFTAEPALGVCWAAISMETRLTEPATHVSCILPVVTLMLVLSWMISPEIGIGSVSISTSLILNCISTGSVLNVLLFCLFSTILHVTLTSYLPLGTLMNQTGSTESTKAAVPAISTFLSFSLVIPSMLSMRGFLVQP
mmetsp:Transcript_36492/g.79516  ORF Transcript_36492/g.79516 Transcript_36492/m.79516 type:complete len:212 (-) Transcript_36492:149-784(-)